MDEAARAQVHAQMVRFAQGHRDAFEEVYVALWPRLLAFTSGLLQNPSEAEDAAQTALLKVFSRITDFNTRRDGVAWAFGIAAYEVRSLRRQRNRRREASLGTATSTPDSSSDAQEALIAQQLRQALAQTLSYLSEMDREALLAPGADQGSEALPPHMRKRRQRAMERLRSFWRKLYGPP
ncbi:RNA polymerase sigma factor [Hyalangium rubrum]|uniref:Sigma-70 family RNA polymerase sigma factor n=1 Tax=Hyalangium rubrum TaxID=3103134 RepID=A0ABU5H0Y5_9BACT|nr:sigma-70 family RNA polymerase sigma factor [Hyalangium sp. s54d21]MDY7226966.1 sigma-70 family RNA polymerase sigma factor [Hyalangium sp. s54d21]